MALTATLSRLEPDSSLVLKKTLSRDTKKRRPLLCNKILYRLPEFL